MIDEMFGVLESIDHHSYSKIFKNPPEYGIVVDVKQVCSKGIGVLMVLPCIHMSQTWSVFDV